MTDNLTNQIRRRLSTDASYSGSEHVVRCAATYNQALIALVDECDRLSAAGMGHVNQAVGGHFLHLVAAGLGITKERAQ